MPNRQNRALLTVLLLPFLLLFAGQALAQAPQPGIAVPQISEPAGAEGVPLRVGVIERPPFAMRTSSGGWTGIGVDLWRMIAEREGLAFEWVPIEENVEERVANGTIDLALPVVASVSGIEEVDYTIPFYTATIGAAGATSVSPWSVAQAFLTWQFLRIVLGITAILFVVGVIMWLIERKANPDEFGCNVDGASRARGWLHGVGNGFWWSGVTMTTIGYGDKAPRTTTGRSIALVWMLVAMALTSSLTASIVAATDLQSMGKLQLPGDLRGQSLAAIEDTATADFLRDEGLEFTAYETIEEAFADASTDKIDAVVGPVPLLRHANDSAGSNLTISPSEANPSRFSIALPQGSDQRRILDRAILDHTTGSGWTALVDRYAPDS